MTRSRSRPYSQRQDDTRPGGEALGVAPGAIFPAIKQPGSRAMVYEYQEMRGFTPSSKKLVIVIDPQGVVSDVDYQNTGKWGK